MPASSRWRRWSKLHRLTGDEVMSIDGRGMFSTCKYAIEADVDSIKGRAPEY
jgi:hypothetical protein